MTPLILLRGERPLGLSDEDKKWILEHLSNVFREGLPPVLTRAEAAKALRVGKTKLQQMISSGEIQVCDIGGVRHIPSAEVYRLAAPVVKGARRSPRRATKLGLEEGRRKVLAALTDED